MSTLDQLLIEWFSSLLPAKTTPLVVGLSGPQGCGKSTVAQSIATQMHPQVLVLSLDDFYLAKAERKRLAATVSPIFATRGPPGTHDVNLLKSTLAAFRSSNPSAHIDLPRFSKKEDDRVEPYCFNDEVPRPKIILVEGWLVGASLAEDFISAPPMNATEKSDADCSWRRYQAEQLRGPYATLWRQMDRFIHIEGPGIDAIRQWRLQQEADNLGIPQGSVPLEREHWVAQFIEHFERLTKDMAQGCRTDGAAVRLNEARQVIEFHP
ncbi:MAG: AAA family ATPase [Pseudomonadota bacterium]